jgi:hypothetical protein
MMTVIELFEHVVTLKRENEVSWALMCSVYIYVGDCGKSLL